MSEEDHLTGAGAQPGSATTDASPVDRFGRGKPERLGVEMKPHELDSEKAQRLHGSVLSHYLRELDIQRDHRALMQQDEGIYDHKHWSSYDEALVRKRGQEPLVYNVTATTINWLIGTERRTRSDFKVLPRRKDGSRAAERKSQLLKYIADVNRTEFSWSQAFAEVVKAGAGWMEAGVQEEDEGEPIYEGYESWRNIIADSCARGLDLSDGRYMFRPKWADVDTLATYFPERRHIVEMAATATYDLGAFLDRHGDDAMDSQEELGAFTRSNHHEYGSSQRLRVRVIEAWFRVPLIEERISGGEFAGELFDAYSEGHRAEIMTGRATIRRATTMRMHVGILTTAGFLALRKSPYRHNKFPFTPIFAYRDADTMQPYGVIRGLKDMQRDINKRASKALAIMSSNKVIMDKGAVDDIETFAEEVSRPDAVIVKNPGKSLDINADRELADAHLKLMSMTVQMIQQVSGVHDASLGRDEGSRSGRAIIALQNQGALATAQIFDNLRHARQVHGEKMLSLIEQFMTDEKEFRITNKRGGAEFITVNDGMPENDIIRTKADFIIAEDDWNATIRQSQTAEAFELIKELAPVAPQIALMVLDLLFEGMDIANREEIVKRIRQVTGATDPDADPNQPDPEAEARAAAAAEQAELEKRAAEAQVAKTEAEAAEKMARAEKARVDIEKVLASLPGDDLETKRRALEVATQMIAARAAVPVADRLLGEAGFNFGPPQVAATPEPAAPAVAPMQ